jgi:hypothetical protein
MPRRREYTTLAHEMGRVGPVRGYELRGFFAPRQMDERGQAGMLRLRHILLASAALLGCSPGPSGNGRWLTQPTPDQHAALFFPIASGPHAVECNSCHGASDSFQDFDCLTCHKAPATGPRHSKVGGFAYASPSCYGCHPDGLAKGVAAVNHTPLFPISAGDVHALGASAVHLAGTIQCTSCHTRTADRKQVDCTVCHDSADQSAKHSGLIGQEPDNGGPLWSGAGPAPAGGSANCLLCHSNGGLQRVGTHGQSPAHSAGFRIAKGNHFLSCEQCHTARVKAPARKNAELDFAAANCANCHSQAGDLIITKHRGLRVDLTTPPATTASCLNCHPDGGTAANFTHAGFPIALTAIHALGAPAVHLSGTISCGSCHPAAATGGDYTKADCTICHASGAMQPLHVAVADLPASYASPDTATFATTALCLKCHADSTVPVSISNAHTPPAPAHAPFLVSSGQPHYQKGCLGCHLASRTDKPWAVDFKQPTRCTTGCHADPKTTTNHLGSSWPGYPGTYRYDDAACISCHSAGNMGPFVHANFPTAATDVHSSGIAPCLSCHANPSAPADVTSINCIGCHDNSASSVDPGGVNSKHTPPAAGVNMIGFGYAFDSSTPAAAVATNGQCLKCHAGTIATRSWTNPLKLPLVQHDSLCFRVTSGAHRVDQIRAGTPACFLCHNTMNTAPRPWGVNWAQAQCTACHNNTTAPTCR